MRTWLLVALLLCPSLASAQDAGGADAGCVDYTGAPCPPLACDGALCDTTNGAGCSSSGSPTALLLTILGAMALGFTRRRSKIFVFVAALSTANIALAEPEPPVDVVIHEAPPPRRFITAAFSPLPLIVGKVSFELVAMPIEHHALVLSPYYASSTTAPIYVFSDTGQPTQLPKQTFSGYGGELGYRYYFGRSGPRGFFLGPSLILGWFTATAQNGDQTQYRQSGIAADIGSQMLVTDRVSLILGGGLQYLTTDKTIPPQQYPAKIYANKGVLPRVLFSLGLAL
jgi:hypothetical protein